MYRYIGLLAVRTKQIAVPKKVRKKSFCSRHLASLSADRARTGGHCIQTHPSLPLFTSRTHFQSHECKRFLNNEDVDLTLGRPPDREQVAGLLIVAGAGAAKEPGGCTEEELPQSDAEFGAQDEDGGASEPSQPGEDDAASELSQQDGGEKGSEPSGVTSNPLRWTSMVNLRGNEQELKDKKRRSTQTTSCLQASTSFARRPASSTTGCIVALL